MLGVKLRNTYKYPVSSAIDVLPNFYLKLNTPKESSVACFNVRPVNFWMLKNVKWHGYIILESKTYNNICKEILYLELNKYVNPPPGSYGVYQVHPALSIITISKPGRLINLINNKTDVHIQGNNDKYKQLNLINELNNFIFQRPVFQHSVFLID